MFDSRPPTPWRDEPTPWPDPASDQSRPVVTAPAPPPAKAKRRHDGLALLLIGALIGGLAGIGGARALVPSITGAAPAASSAASSTATAGDLAAQQAAIKDVLQRANQAQAEAFAKNDPTPMRATSTDNHYAEMVRINADLASGGVTKIELLDMTFGDITVNGATATATTNETWRSTYADGTIDQSTDQNDYVLMLEGGAWKIESNTQPGNTGVTAPTQPRTPANATVRPTSRNWSGYVATGGSSYTSVSGTWVIAKPDPTVLGIDATWVGIGGANTTDLIQAGTEATVNGDGTVTYDAWTETLPQSTRTVSLAVNGGDTVSVTIAERSAGLWVVDLKNVTTGKTFTTTIRYDSSKASAEWIEEAPSLGRGIAPLDSFGTVKFTGGSVTVDGTKQTLAGANAKPVTMADAANRPLAIPSAIGSDGSSFSVSRTSNPGTNLGTGGRSPGRRRG
ncbi:MAG TPA: G1 family glutamic endopeptidase [Candidatus Limnocylindria bacterium]|nr:G1 family glutamic endopeptidase [Candidatus Limnocylindria bacterium]